MMADSKRRSFPEFAELLSKEPGWADEESALQEILGAFLRGQLSDVTCPRNDVAIGEHGVLLTRVAIPGPDPNPAVLPDPMYIPDRLIEMEPPLRHKYVPTLSPPQQPFTRDDWREGFRAFGGQGQNVEVISFEALAEFPISVFPPDFRQAYIEWLFTTDAEIARWLQEHSKPVAFVLRGDTAASPTEASPPDAQTSGTPETRKEKRARETQEKYKRWYDTAQGIRSEGKWTRPTDIASATAKRVGNATAGNVKRRLDEHFPGWARGEVAQEMGEK